MTELTRTMRCLSVVLILSWVLVPGVFGSASVTLAWDPSPDPDVVGYRVYVGQSSGVYAPPVDLGNQTSVTISNLQEGIPYFFAVTAYNSLGLESDPSNEVSFTPPIVDPPRDPNAPLFTRARLLMKPQMTFTAAIEGPVDQIYRIEASEDLRNWALLQTLTNVTGSIQVSDLDSSNHEMRFYRVIMSRFASGVDNTTGIAPTILQP